VVNYLLTVLSQQKSFLKYHESYYLFDFDCYFQNFQIRSLILHLSCLLRFIFGFTKVEFYLEDQIAIFENQVIYFAFLNSKL